VVLADCQKTASSTVGNPEKVSELGFDFRIDENYDFKVVDLLIELGSLMICIHDLYVLTKRKRNDLLLQIVRIWWPRRSRQMFLSF
jgi:hypothetical protein